MNKIFVLIFAIVFFNQPSYAYIDPFTGGFIIQAIMVFFATMIFYLGYPIRIIKKIYNKIFKKKKRKVNN
jgi:hypothetical protein